MKSRFLIKLEDRLRYSPLIRSLLCEYRLLKHRQPSPHDTTAIISSIQQLCAGARLAPSGKRLLSIEKKINEHLHLLEGVPLDWSRYAPRGISRNIHKSALLKPWVSEREKGVLFVAFEEQWCQLLACPNLEEFASRYTLVVAPSWSPPHNFLNYIFPARYPGRIYSLISNQADVELLPRVSSKFHVVPLLASNWVNPEAFQPLPFEKKDIDILMVASFGKYKRHHVLFEALRHLPTSLRVQLIGQYDGARNARSLLDEAASFGVQDRFQLLESQPHSVVSNAFSRAKISLILSKREGSCVAVTESIFADTPVGVLEGAEIGSSRYINDATGRYLTAKNLPAQLLDFINSAQHYHPRKWALDNGISCLGSTQVLNSQLKEQMLADGQEWTQDIAALQWNPNPTLVHQADFERLRPARDEIYNRFGITIGSSASETKRMAPATPPPTGARRTSIFSRAKIELEDRLRYSHFVRGALSELSLLKQRQPATQNPQSLARAIFGLCAAARLASRESRLLEIEKRIRLLVDKLGGAPIDWREFESTATKRRLETGIVLKPWISEREKGVFFLSFEEQWARLLHNCDPKEFAKRYNIVVAPVWASPHGLPNFYLPSAWPDPVFCTISDPNDAQALPRISPNYIVVPLLCSNWVNPELYNPVKQESKDIDIFMLANFGKYKRHHVLFNALRELPATLKVVLVGTRNGDRTAESLMSEARAYGVQDRFELLESPPDSVVLNALARSKISLILSQREGSCVAIVESIFANTPVGMIDGAEVGSRVFINSSTGRFLRSPGLAGQLQEFLAQAHQYSPRRWADENNISCHGSSRRLNEIIKRQMLATGQEWTQDIAEHHWRPTPQLIHAADRQRMRSANEDIRTRFGLELGVA